VTGAGGPRRANKTDRAHRWRPQEPRWAWAPGSGGSSWRWVLSQMPGAG
jgi:hypothetical protein